MHGLIEAFTFPRWIEAKPGCIDGVGAWAKKFGTRAFVCTGRSAARKAGLLGRVEKSLKAQGLEYEIFDGIPAEPLLEIAEQGAVLAKKKACEVFIGLGGGSVLDVAKVAAFVIWISLNPDWSLNDRRGRHRKFLKQLGQELIDDYIQVCLQNPRILQPNVRDALKLIGKLGIPAQPAPGAEH